MKTLVLTLLLLGILSTTQAQNTYIADQEFEQKLIYLGLDDIVDGSVLTSNIDTLHELEIVSSLVSDLTGIEDFTSLTHLDCSYNELTNIDISNNINLTNLNCSSNYISNLNISNNINLIDLDCSSLMLNNIDISNNYNLTKLNIEGCNISSIDLHNNVNLIELNCAGNQLTNIDISYNTSLLKLICANNPLQNLDVSFNTQLINLFCYNTQLTNIDLSNNTNLLELNCSQNVLTNIDVSNNYSLQYLDCASNKITSIDLTNNISLTNLYCHYNKLENLNLSNNVDLAVLICGDNKLVELDVSNNPNLIELMCDDNRLITLNVKNGNNINISSFYTRENPLLSCIQVDNEVYSTDNWTAIDYWTSFSENCYDNCKILGNILKDNNCILDGNEQAIKNIIVRTEPEHFYSITDSLGAYTIFTDTGTYQVKQFITHPFIIPLCPMPNYHTVVLDTLAQDTTDINFFNEILECPLLTVDLNSDRRRRCFKNYTYVEYCNTGFADASGVEVMVQMPEYVILVSANYPYTVDTSGNYVFDIGNLAQGECGNIHIIDSVACESDITGLTQCTKAWITPPNNCLDNLDTASYDAWDKSSIMVTGECVLDSIVRFIITNTGDFGNGDMETTQEYRIYADNSLVVTETFQLNGGESINIDYPANGETIRLEADQHPMHPGNSHPQETIEACGGNNGQISTGFVNTMPMDDADENVEVDCMEIRDSYDPNEKSVSPSGVTANNYLAAGTVLDYQIGFQNTGTDTAFTVVVVDTLSENLNPATIQWGVSSHPYTIDVSGMGTPVLRFTFNNINLPDSTINERASHGFVKFKIASYDSLANGTLIDNKAYIYFDYNEPVITNTAQITISDTVLVGTPYTIIEESKQISEFDIYPNPTKGTITIRGKYIEHVEIYNISGVLIKTTNKKEIDLRNNAKGVYFVKVIAKETTITKKIVLE